MTGIPLTRRALFAASTGALVAPMLMSRVSFAQTNEASMKFTPKTNSFKFGDFSIAAINDGLLPMGEPGQIFGLSQDPNTIAELLKANYLPTDNFVNGFTPTLIDTGSDVVLFDTGMGEGGRPKGVGQLRAGIEALGYTPDQVTVVVLTHMHGDHIGGLMEGGAPAFPNARYFAGQVEYDFWKDPAREGTPAEGGHKGVLKNVVPLADKMTFMKDGDTVVPGIQAMEAFGHSPGHMIFNVESAGKRMIVTGDTANHFVLSLQRPDWEVKFDMDKEKAAATRKKVFDMIATDRVPFIGYHMPFPAAGYVEKIDQGYRFIPESYQFEL